MSTSSRSYRVFCLASILSLLLNLASPLSTAWKPSPALAAASVVAPASTGDNTQLDSVVTTSNALQSQVATHPADAGKQPAQDPAATVAAAVRNAPIMFIENVGQFASGARFQVQGGHGAMYLAGDALWFTGLERVQTDPAQRKAQRRNDLSAPARDDQPRKGVNVKATFVGANPNPHLEPFNRLDTHVSYLIGNDPKQWHTNVPVWGGVRYKDLYPGIDLEVTGEKGQTMQRLVVRPGANLNAVRLRVEGAQTLEAKGGRLNLTTTVGQMTVPLLQAVNSDGSALKPALSAPVVSGNEISSPFASASLSALDASPSTSALVYSTFLGGGDHDGEHAIAVDGSGQAYLAGFTNPPGFPATPGAFQTTLGGNVDATIVKVNSAGSAILYATYLGGNGYDTPHGIAIDASGNAFVTGETTSQNFPTTAGAFQTTPVNYTSGKTSAFIAKLNPTGSGLVYSSFLSGSSAEDAYSVAIDGTGAAYVTGMTFSADFPVTLGAFQTNFVGHYTDAFVTKMNPTGSALIYSTFLGGSANDDGDAIAVGPDGAAVVGGRTYSTDFPSAGGFRGRTDGFVTKLNATGSALVYSTFVGGASYDEINALATDQNGAVYIAGETSSPDLGTTPGAFQPAISADSDDGFVAKLNASGSIVYSTYLGGNNWDYAGSGGIAIDPNGAAYILEFTSSTDMPTSADALDKTNNGDSDTYIAELSPDGSTLTYGTYLGGSAEEDPGGIAVDGYGTIYAAGYTYSSDFPVTPYALQQSCGSCGAPSYTADGFVARIASAPVLAALLDSHVLSICCPKGDKAGDPRVGATSSVVGNNGAIQIKGDPINTRTGAIDYSTVDLSFPALGGQMVFQRSYSSLATSLYTTTLGYGWTHNQDTRLILPGGGALGGAASPLMSSAKSVSTATATSARTATAVGGTPVMFIENVGQFDASSRFQVHGAQGTLFLAPNAIWLTALEHAPSGGKFGATDPASQTKDLNSTPRKGVGLKESFPGANAQAKLEPFNRLKTHVSYFAGNNPKQWHADVPVWGGVRYKDLYPGIDLEITSEQGQLVQKLVAQPGANLDAVRLRLEGANSLAVEAGRVKAATSVGPLSLPLLRAVAPDGSPAKRSQAAPAVKGNEVAAPFAASTALPRTALSTTEASGAMELLYSTFIGGSYEETGYAIAVDPIGAAYITGDTPSSDMPVVPGSFDTSPSANYEAYVAKLNTAGSGLDYATFLGQTLNSRGNGIAVDAVGNAYVTGETNDPNFPLTPGKTVDTTQSAHEAFVTMLDPLGTSLGYSTFLGGSADDYAYGIAVDAGGEAFITGRTASSDFPVTAGAYATSLGGNSDAFVAKLTRSGGGLQLGYATFLGGGNEDDGYGIAVDASGNAYITGRTYSSNFPATTGAFYTSLRGGNDAFVTKLDPSGSTLVYSTFLGGYTDEGGYGIALDASGAAYVTGVTDSFEFPTTAGAFSTSRHGMGDAFVTKLDPTGSTLAYSTYLGGSSNSDNGQSIAVDASGQASVTGYTYSADFPLTTGAYDSSFNGQDDAFVTELNATGSALVYSTYVGGSTDDRGYGLAVDGSGAIFVTGQTNSLDWPATPGAFQTTCNNCSFYSMHDSFVLKLGTRPALPAASGQILFKPHNANQLTFTINGDGTFSPYPGILASLVSTTNPPGYRLTASDQSVYVFDPTGRLLTWADGQGHTWSYDYDGQGRLARVRDATGQRFLILGYDPNGRLASVRDPLGRTVQYGYDANGDLATYTDARSKMWTYHYDGTTHLLTEIVDPLGHTVERTEYDQGRAVRQFDGNGAKTLEIVYNADGSRTITDGAGDVTTGTYDSRGTATSVQDAAGQTQKQFDANFRPSQITDPNTHPTTLTWSADGANLTQVTDAQQHTTSLFYDSLNNLTRTVDALGRTSNFTYDPGSRLLRSSTDDLGNTTYYTYTAQGFLEAQTDARGNTTHYTYNTFGQRTSVTDAANHTSYFDYDLVGRLITTTDALQHKTVNEYDNEDKLTKVTQNYLAGQPQNYQNEWNIVTQYSYDDARRRVTTTDTLGRVTKNDYDAAGRLIKTTQNYDAGQPQNGDNQYNIVTQYAYDNAGRQTFITDTLGYVTRNEYDSAGRLWKTTVNYQDGVFNPAEPDRDLITTYGFDAAGNVTSKTDPLGRVTWTEYDELNRVKKVIANYVDGIYNAAEPDKDMITQTTYDEVGNVQTTTDPLGHVTRTDYDRLNRPTKVTVNYVDGVYNPAEPDKDLVTLQHYDSVGNRDLVTNTLGYETQTEFDALNRTARVTQNPLAGQPQNYQNEYNIVTQYGYNELGSQTTTIDTSDRVTKNDYDAFNRVKVVTANYVQGAPADEQTNVTTSYSYDALGNRLTATDPLTHVTSWDYDALGRVLTETRPLANVTAYVYDPRGNRTRVTDPRNHATQYGYDGLSRNTLVTDTLGQVTRYVYDAGGRRTQEIDPLTHSTTYAYDDADRQTTVTDALTHITRYGYDGLGNRVKMTDAREVITAYWYDAANRLKGVIENYVQGGGSDQQTNVTTSYAYDGLGNRTQIHDALGHDTNFTYDRLNRVHTEADALSHTTTYGYYPTGQRSMLTDAKNQQTLYLYDNLGRLTKTIYSADGTNEQYGYDAVGNRKVMTDTVGVTQYSYDDLNRLKRVIDPYSQTVGYDYDAAGNRTLITYPDTKQASYSYTALNRLESVKDWANQWTYYGYDQASRPITATLPNGVTTSYAYDIANRLTGLSHTANGGSVTLGDYQFGLDAMGNRTAVTETLQTAGLGGARRVVTATQILLPFLSNQAAPAQPTIQSSQNPILLPFLWNGSEATGPSEWRPTLPVDPLRREPGRAPTVVLPTPNKTAVPKTAAPGQTRVPTRALVVPTASAAATPTDQVRSGLLPRAVESATASSSMTFNPVADSYVDSANPTVNHGTETQIRVDGSPTVNSYLRFTVQGVTGTISRVTLKVYANSAQTTGYTAKAVADNTWTETGLTYNNAPAIGSAIGSSGPVTANTWTSVDVTSYITGNGTFNLALTTSNSTALSLAAREAGANAPQLVIEMLSGTIFTPTIDSYVDSANPTVNHGTETQIRVDGSPVVNSYLRFTVQGLTGSVTKATLRIYANSAQTTGYTAKAVADNTWTETGITYNNAPAIGSAIGSSGPVTANTWTSVDVTSYITGNGTFNLALTTSNSTALSLASREAGAHAPQLVVETAGPVVETTAIGYTYDPLDRLTGASYTGTLTNTFAYTYDAVGNRQTQVIDGTTTSYGYDNANRLTTVNGVTYSWDNNGNLLNDGAKTYSYDQANRLKQVVQGAITTTLAYNGVGDRLSQTVGAATAHYVLDPAAGLTQVLSDGTNTYLYGNERLAQYQTGMQYFGADGLGSVRQIYDASAQVIGSTRYDPYGNVMAQSGSTSVFAFAGEQQDATGLEYLRARYYSAAQGRFTTRDVWEGDPNAPMSYNAWNYTSGNPVNLADPSGKCEENGDEACWGVYEQIIRICPECGTSMSWPPGTGDQPLYKANVRYLEVVLRQVQTGWNPSLRATQYIELIRAEAKRYGIPWQVLGAVLEAEIRQDTKWYDPIETFGLGIVRWIPDNFATDRLNPGPGIGNVHGATARSTAQFFSKYYGDCPKLSLDIRPSETNWGVGGKLTSDAFTIKVMAAHVRELADWRFGSDGKPLLASHNTLSDWRIEDGVAIWHAYRYGIEDITPQGQGFALEVFQNRKLTISQLIEAAGGTDGGLNISKSRSTFERYFAIRD